MADNSHFNPSQPVIAGRELAQEEASLKGASPTSSCNLDFQQFFNHCQIGLWRMDLSNGCFLMANQATLDILEFSSLGEFQANGLASLDSLGGWSVLFRILKNHGRISAFHLPLDLATGSRRELSVSGVLHQEEGFIDGTFEDISRRKKAEESLETVNSELATTMDSLKKTQDYLVQSEKIVGLAGVVAGVAHELNTPLGNAVTAASHLHGKTMELHQSYGEGQMTQLALESFLETADQSCSLLHSNLKRAIDLINSFKLIAVDQNSEVTREIDLGHFLKEIFISLELRLNECDAALDLDIPSPIFMKSCPGALVQVVTNLVENSLAHGFTKGLGGKINLSAVKHGKQVTLTYQDDGQGMDDETRCQAFDAFFTTKRDQGGRGLGLNLVFNLVTRKLGGKIQCNSKPGIGTEFKLELPLSMATENSETPLEDCQTHVLLVDDDPIIRSVTVELLGTINCKATTAADGPEGVATFNQLNQQIDLVILDLVMPGMCGEDVMGKMQEINPDVPVILTSGFNVSPEEGQKLLDSGAKSFLKKPFPLAELKKTINAVVPTTGAILNE